MPSNLLELGNNMAVSNLRFIRSIKISEIGVIVAIAGLMGSPAWPQEDLAQAILNEDVNAIETRLNENPALADLEDADGDSPLRIAASTGNMEITELLLTYGASIDDQGPNGRTAMFIAALYEEAPIILRLLEAGADTELRDEMHRTPLLISARQNGNLEVMTTLIDGGADFNADDNTETVLSFTAWRGYQSAVELLLDRGVELPSHAGRERRLVRRAAENGLDRLFGHLLEAGADVDIPSSNGGSLLHTAAIGGSMSIVSGLVENGAAPSDVDRYGFTALHYAAENGHTETVNFLASTGSDIDQATLGGDSALSLALSNGHPDTAERLRALGATSEQIVFPARSGDYLGESLPDGEARLFAVGSVSSHRFEHGSVSFSPDGDEAYWSSSFMIPGPGFGRGRLLFSTQTDGVWGAPQESALVAPDIGSDVPVYSADGQTLYFISREPVKTDEGIRGPERIWFSRKTPQGWSDPELIENGPNAIELHWGFSVAASGDVYFGSGDSSGFGRDDIYVSRYEDGQYQSPENLGPVINSASREGDPHISADGSFLLFVANFEDSEGRGDIYLSRRNDDGSWAAPQNLGPLVNSGSQEGTPVLSPDGLYLFFNSHRSGNADNYWIDVASIEVLSNARD
jgi:ankyrin repeat protein